MLYLKKNLMLSAIKLTNRMIHRFVHVLIKKNSEIYLNFMLFKRDFGLLKDQKNSLRF